MTTVAEPSPSAFGRDPVSLPAAPATSFLGRSDELRGLGELLASQRLVTLTGPPGVGKTRLALELARSRVDDYADGAVLVDLVPIRDPAHLPGRLAHRLGVPEVPGVSVREALIGHLSGHRLLLLLDNCEHLQGACADLVACLLDAVPDVSFLTTSREPLAIRHEAIWRVRPLPVPAPDMEAEPEALMRYPAVRLFVERARSVERAFDIGPHIAGALAAISRRLDGLPLALELAAAGVEYLTPPEIATRLDDRSRLLSAGGDGAVARHRTLQTALDWSHDLLPMAERVLLARLSVFTGDFCLEDVEGVCAGDGLPGAHIAAVFGRVHAKSLVATGGESRAGPRYRLLETIRAYAGERLEEAGEVRALRNQHALYYLRLAELAEPQLAGPDQKHWFERLESEHANLRAALDWSLGHGEIELALRLAGALVLFWRIRGFFSEGRDALRAILSASADAAAGLRAKALWGEGFMTLMAGDPEAAGAPLEQSLELFRELGDKQGIARTLLILANQRQLTPDPGVLELLDESAALAREVGDHWCLAHALGVAGFEHARRVDLGAARPKLEECLRVARQAADEQGLRIGLLGLGEVALAQGDYEAAQDALGEAVAITRELGEDLARAEALCQLAELALARGQYARARSLAGDALAVLPRVASPQYAAGGLTVLGRAAQAEGDLTRARAYYEEALAKEDGSFLATVWLAELWVSEGDAPRARRRLEQSCGWARAIGATAYLARCLYALAELPRRQEDAARASILHLEALELRIQVGAVPEIVSSLEAVAALAVAGDRPHLGVRLLAATRAVRDGRGYVAMPADADRAQAALALAREKLPTWEFDAAYAEGQALSLDEALALARRRRPRRARTASGWASLSERERQVAALVAESMTNPQIAGALHVSLATVKTHLLHIYGKLGIPGRRELAREFRRHEHLAEPAIEATP